MRHVFIVETAHQLKQVHLALAICRLASAATLIVVERTCYSGDVIGRIEDEFPGIEHVVFDSWRFSECWKKRMSVRKYMSWCRAMARQPEPTTLYSCHYDSDTSSLFYAIARPSEYILLDEGTASFNVVIKRKRPARTNVRLLVKSFIYGCRLTFPRKLIYFTRFNMKIGAPDTLIRYQLPRIKNSLTSLEIPGTAFIGTSLVDLKMINEEKYLVLLKAVKRREAGELIYYPHRKEARRRFERIEACGYTVKETNEPFERYFGNQSSFHSRIASFHTSAVVGNLAAMFETLPALVVYTFPDSYLQWGAEPQQLIIAELKQHSNIAVTDVEAGHATVA